MFAREEEEWGGGGVRGEGIGFSLCVALSPSRLFFCFVFFSSLSVSCLHHGMCVCVCVCVCDCVCDCVCAGLWGQWLWLG